MISIDKLTIRFNGIALFENLTFMINQGDKIGLVGKNGAGKSTLIKTIKGRIEPDEGTVSIQTGKTIGYLPQELDVADTQSLREEALAAFDEINALKQRLEKYNEALVQRTDYESDEYLKIIEQVTDISEKIDMLGGNSMEKDVEQILLGLGFLQRDFDRHTSEFSGGWRMRIELAKILLQKPDLLLLDEPTNHLDIESIQWVEDFLKNYSGAIVLISHDRAFLDAITNRTVEIVLGRIEDYKAPYSRYLDLRAERREQQTAAYENQQKMIQDTEKFIERFRSKATKAVQVQSRIKQLEKIERIEIEQDDTAAMHFRFPPAPRSGTIVVESLEVSKKYGDLEVLAGIDFVIERGEKVAFVGKNGEGKTTFSRCIIGELDYSGSIKVGHNVNVGYFAQNQDQLLNPDKTVFETLDDIAVGDVRMRVRDILGSFLFSGEDIDKKTRVLSGGERNRLALAKLMLEPYNLLVLDEPTNHLDIKSKAILKNALTAYDGTLILVSHDRSFLDGLAETIYEFRDKSIKQYPGGISVFLEKKKVQSFKEFENTAKQTKAKEDENKSSGNELYQQKKELDKQIRKQKKITEDAEQAITQLEKEIEGLQNLMNDPGKVSDNTLFQMHEKLEKQLEDVMQKWEQAGEQLEKLETEKKELLK